MALDQRTRQQVSYAGKWVAMRRTMCVFTALTVLPLTLSLAFFNAPVSAALRPSSGAQCVLRGDTYMTWSDIGDNNTKTYLTTYWESPEKPHRIWEGVSHRHVSHSGDLSEKTPAEVNNTSYKFYYSFDVGDTHDVHGFHAACRNAT
jgi:hypothetical protein